MGISGAAQGNRHRGRRLCFKGVVFAINMTPLDRARAYVASCPPAISGQGGHDQTFSVACALVNGFALEPNQALDVLGEYNQRCQPPWSDKELTHKIQTAMASTKHEKPRGHLLGGSVSFRFSSGTTTPPPAAKAPPAGKPATRPRPVTRSLELPKPIEDSTRRLIEAAFYDGECVCIAQEQIGEDGRGLPKDSGATLPRADWVARLTSAGGDPNKIWSSTDRAGAYIRVNPLKHGGSKDADV